LERDSARRLLLRMHGDGGDGVWEYVTAADLDRAPLHVAPIIAPADGESRRLRIDERGATVIVPVARRRHGRRVVVHRTSRGSAVLALYE
jgi:hypothetical protein